MIALHYQSGGEFYLNPSHLEHMQWAPAENLTLIRCDDRVYRCIETPEQVNVLIQGGQIAINSPTGPAYGDGSPLEARHSDPAYGAGGPAGHWPDMVCGPTPGWSGND
jgi:uncharacterized protein YlzI (FlbEa/FlbD family)